MIFMWPTDDAARLPHGSGRRIETDRNHGRLTPMQAKQRFRPLQCVIEKHFHMRGIASPRETTNNFAQLPVKLVMTSLNCFDLVRTR